MENKRKARIEHEEVVERFAGRLRELRTERGMTQAELAESSGVTATYVSKLEGAGAAPGIDLVQKLAAALGVSAADLIPGGIPDEVEVARRQAEKLFAALMRTADRQTFALLNPFLALLADSAGKRA